MSKKIKSAIIYLVVSALCYILGDLLQLNDFLISAVALFLAYFVVYLFNKNK